MNEKEISKINEGRRASITLDWVTPLFDDQKKKLVTDLKHLYRTGDATEAKLLAVAAGLCTIDEIEFRLKTIVRQGESINARE